MAITEDDRRALGDLALRALDTIAEDYGEDAELVTAALVFEVKTVDDEDDEDVWHGNYKSIDGTSPHHIAGLLRSTADYLQSPS